MPEETLERTQYLYSWAWLFLPVLLATIILRRDQAQAVLFPSIAKLRAVPRSARLVLRGPVLWTLFAVAACSLTIALSRPQIQTIIQNKAEARNLMLVIDLSRSMTAVDFDSERGIISRMGGVKTVVGEFIAGRTRDRLGLVVFGSSAFLQCPLTLDHSLLEQLVARLEAGMAGDATAMGDGLGVALKRMRHVDANTGAIILLTDGVSNSGQVSPIKAAALAKDLGIKVYTIGIGSTERERGLFSTVVGPNMEFDEGTLKKIAEITGGSYFNAQSLEGLKEVYAQIDELERSASESPESKQVEELFPKYALIALLAFGLYWLLKVSVFLKVPNG